MLGALLGTSATSRDDLEEQAGPRTEQVIMQRCGWKTLSVLDRYRIVAGRDLADLGRN